jgi:hypothetical protein
MHAAQRQLYSLPRDSADDNKDSLVWIWKNADTALIDPVTRS